MGAPDRKALPRASAGPVANTVHPHEHLGAALKAMTARDEILAALPWPLPPRERSAAPAGSDLSS
jgi:hypothetical protein